MQPFVMRPSMMQLVMMRPLAMQPFVMRPSMMRLFMRLAAVLKIPCFI